MVGSNFDGVSPPAQRFCNLSAFFFSVDFSVLVVEGFVFLVFFPTVSSCRDCRYIALPTGVILCTGLLSQDRAYVMTA